MKEIKKSIIRKERFELELIVGVKLTKYRVVEEHEVIRETDKSLGLIDKFVSSTVISTTKHVVSEYPMKSIELDEVQELRNNKKAGLLVKIDDQYYYAKITPGMKFTSDVLLGPHMCSDCKRMSANTDERGGCAKVRNYRCNHIEKYGFITEGYESFNTHQNCLVVVKCANYEKNQTFKQPSESAKNSVKLSLAQYVWPDVKSMDEVREKNMYNFEIK